MVYLSKAIWKLRPSAEFSFQDEDYSTIKWDVLEGNPPTKNEIDETIELIKLEESQLETQSQAKRQAALDKLAALGLNEDDLQALGL